MLQAFTPGAAGGLESVVQVLGIGLARRGVDLAVTAVLGEGAPEPPSVVALREAVRGAGGTWAVVQVAEGVRRYLRLAGLELVLLGTTPS